MTRTKKEPQQPSEPEQPSQEEKDKQIWSEAHTKGFLEGSTKVYEAYDGFLQSRMLQHFAARNDDLAKEIREIYLTNKEALKKLLT